MVFYRDHGKIVLYMLPTLFITNLLPTELRRQRDFIVDPDVRRDLGESVVVRPESLGVVVLGHGAVRQLVDQDVHH